MPQQIYKFNNATFVLKSKDLITLSKQIKHISQFYTETLNSFCGDETSIEYIENEKLFNNVLNKLKKIEYKSYQTFTNQIHYEYNVNGLKYYLIDNKEYLCIKKAHNDYCIISDGKPSGEKWPFRIIREILVRKNEDSCGLFMHGTGFNIDGKGIALLGNSGSGKTTLMTKIFETDSNIKMLSNDRIFIYDDIKPMMEYFPIPIVYPIGTVKNSKHLIEYFKQTEIFEKRTGKSFENSKTTDKVDVPLTDISKIFCNVNLVNESELNYIIFPNITNEEGEKIVELTKLEKEIMLNQTCFTIFDWESLRLPWIQNRVRSNNDIIENKINTILKIIENIPIIKLNYNFTTNGEKIKKLIKKI